MGSRKPTKIHPRVQIDGVIQISFALVLAPQVMPITVVSLKSVLSVNSCRQWDVAESIGLG